LHNVQTFCRLNLPYTIEANSDGFFQKWRSNTKLVDVFEQPTTLGGPISFCYIDGSHRYEFARRDFENTDQFLVSGGFILFDDSADGSGWDVCKVVQEVLALGAYELVAKNPNYLFQKK
jgi:hypothetical protein